MTAILLFLILIINFLLIYHFDHCSKFFNIYDNPDNIRKLHNKKTSLFGGSIFLINIIFLTLILNFNLIDVEFFIDAKYFISFFFPILLIFFVGLYDDKFNLNPYIKFILITFILIFATYVDDDFVIKKLYFKSFNFSLSLGSFSTFFTILCVLLFTNALNLFDGINLQVGSYIAILLLFFIISKIFLSLSLFLLLPLFSFLYLNYKKKTFLGDNGTHILAFIISYIIIKQNNYVFSKISAEDIFILMMIPGIDMLRLFIQRLLRFKNPFMPDRCHLHHYLLNKVEFKYSFLIVQSLVLLPIILIPFSHMYSIIFGISLYILILLKIIK